jgi:predicted DsbA family dithiol-disulfide isomerase
VRIDFVFDTVCPWCYVGKRRFQRALAMRPGVRVDITWRPFLLNPDLPLDGVDRRAYLDRKFGGPARVSRIHSAVTAAGRAEGIDFAFDRIERTPNTLNSHRLVRFATAIGREADVVEALYRAYFCEGRDIGGIEELVAIGAACGLPDVDVADYLYSDADVTAVMNDNARAHRLGVNGVPCLVLDGNYALAGAQEPDILLRLIDIVREAEAEAALS